MLWLIYLVGGKLEGSINTSENSCKTTCMLECILSSVSFMVICRQKAYMALPEQTPLDISLSEAAWISWPSIPANHLVWFSQENSMVYHLQLQTMKSSNLSHWIPRTKSSLVSGREYSVKEKIEPCRSTCTSLNFPWHLRFSLLVTHIVKALIGTTGNRRKLAMHFVTMSRLHKLIILA